MKVFEDQVLFQDDFLQAASQLFWLPQITYPDSAAAGLVLVGRSDTTPGGPDFSFPSAFFPKAIQRLVPRHD